MPKSNNYRLTSDKKLELDPSQQVLVGVFQQYKEIIEQKNKENLIAYRIINFLTPNKSKKHKGLNSGIYIWGSVGRGKSMLLDCFFEDINIKKKIRWHFHEFMLSFHKRLNNWHSQHEFNNKKLDPVIQIANSIAKSCNVICLDELQINNIADAMVIGRIFTALVARGVFIFITSNFAPDDLFKDGLQRELFLPFIEIIKQKITVYHLNNCKDYRLQKINGIETLYNYPINSETDARLSQLLTLLLANHKLESRTVKVNDNRLIEVLKSYYSVALFSFKELCQTPLGAVDYLALCREFRTIIITDIPQLSIEEHNELLRFITLIDCLYEAKTKLICFAQVPINLLYSGEKHSLEFSRTISRLHEMQSNDYLALN